MSRPVFGHTKWSCSIGNSPFEQLPVQLVNIVMNLGFNWGGVASLGRTEAIDCACHLGKTESRA